MFLKLLLNQVTTTSEANLKSLLHNLETYIINTSLPREYINKEVSMFTSVFDNIEGLLLSC